MVFADAGVTDVTITRIPNYRIRVTLSDTVHRGDPIGQDASGNWKGALATTGSVVQARLVALQGGASGDENPLTFTIADDTAITAVFKEEFSLTLDIDGLGSIDPVAGTYTHLDGESITLSFTAKRAAVAIFALIILIVVAFVSTVRFGERRYREGYAVGLDTTLAEAVDEIGEARRQPPATEAIAGLLENTVGMTRETLEDKEQRTAVVGSSSWVLGDNYILVQHFGVGRSADARGAQDFLADRGIATEMVRLGGGAIDLITTQGYNLKDRTQSQTAYQMLDVIHEAGVEYYAAGGGYKLEAYLKKLEKESW